MQATTLHKILITFLLIGFAHVCIGNKINIKQDQTTTFTVKENTPVSLRLDNTIGEIQTMEVSHNSDLYTKLILPSYTHTMDIGKPELPVLRKLIEVPVGSDFSIEIIESSYRDIQLGEMGIEHTILPTQPPVPKSGQAPAFHIDAIAYTTNAFYPTNMVTAENLGTLRAANIGRIDISPVQYNPVTHTLRVYDRIDVRVTFEHADLSATAENKARYENPYFKSISRSLINYRELANRDTISKYPITYLIISDPMFEAQLQPFIEWKTKKGFKVIDAYTNDPQVGSTTYSIKSYIQGMYDTPPAGAEPPSFVLFVGDIAQVPTWTGQAAGHVTDLYYCEFTGDVFPEIYYGRFSAQNTAQLQPQIDKTLMYEQYTMPDPSYLNECVMIAGMDATYGPIHGNGQINYGTENYFNEAHNLFSYTYLYPESGSNAATIRQNISDGVCFANYTAHGSPSGWADPEFNVSQVSQMTNDGMYALLIGNCCSTSEYQVGECFGEAMLRAENKGSLGYIGASNSTYWDEDYYWGVGVGTIAGNPPSYEQTGLGGYDRTWHTHGEPREDWYATMDQNVFAGNLAVTESGSSLTTYYWEAYCLMGDPSLMVYYSEPPAMTVSYLPLMPLGSSSFTVTTDVPYAYVAISIDGVLHGATQADDSGEAVVELDPILTPGMADIIVTSQNREPYIGSVLVANPEGPFILLENRSTTELAGNNNAKNEGNEVIGITVELKNWGNTDGTDITATVTTSDPYVTLSDASESCGTVPAQSTISLSNAFSMIVEPTVPNGHEVQFVLQVTDGNNESWESEFVVPLTAPVMNCNSIIIDDNAGGNGNGRLDAGETADIIYTLSNKGGVMATNVSAELIAHSGFISITDPVQSIGNIGLFGTTSVTYTIVVDSKAQEGTVIDFELVLTSAAYVVNDIHPISIGFSVEDFETGDFSKYPWVMGGDEPWQITSSYPYEGTYSIISGSIVDSETTTVSVINNSTSSDSITFFRKVSSESGDKLQFFVDNQLQGEWSGTTGGWKRTSYPVSAGTHTFKWSYVKNSSGSQGGDAAWIDYIHFPPPLTSTIYAGADDMQCEGGNFQTSATATNYATLEWSTSGSGTFSNVAVINPQYTPSSADLEAGTVTLNLAMTDVDGAAFNDNMELGFTDVPEAPGTPEGPSSVDLSSIYTSDYTTESVAGSDGFIWTVDPAEAGMLVARGETGTIVWSRNWAGTAMIYATASNECGQSDPSPGFAVTVTNGTVGLDEPALSDWSMEVYPNPAYGHLRIDMRNMASRADLQLVNMIGATVWQDVFSAGESNSIDINVRGLRPGMYLLIANDGKLRITKKIVIY